MALKMARVSRVGLQRSIFRAPWSRTKSTAAVTLPGRLGDPSMGMATDPRTHPGVLKAFSPFGLDQPQLETPPIAMDASLETRLAWCTEIEAHYGELFVTMESSWPTIEGVESRTEVIKGIDGNDINLYISVPKNAVGPLPCVYHIHGGGMSLLTAADPNYVYWRAALASTGMIVVGVEFRNAAGKLGPHAFPAGLNDCLSGLQWAHNNKNSLGFSKLIVSGESGGGNLAIATALKAKQEGQLAQIDGVYSLCPYIYGNYSVRCPSLPSLTENDGYFLGVDMMALVATVYDPSGENAQNPLAWPYYASEVDVAGLPPVTISVNDMDPLRDEGLAFFRTLVKAGVPATARTVNGTGHGMDIMLFGAAPEVSWSTLRDIKSFADSL